MKNFLINSWMVLEVLFLILRMSFDREFIAEMEEEIKQEEWERENGIIYS